jgi:cold shock CspA family protein
MNTLNGIHYCARHPQVKLVSSGVNRALNATRFLCPLCATIREYSSGVIKQVNTGRGFFFIDNGSGRDLFAHIHDLAVTFTPRPGQVVQFEVSQSPKGPKALAIRPL